MSNNLTGLLAKNMVDLRDAIEDCYDKGRYMPCLVLLYSGIDVAASLEPSSGTGVGERFTKWVERYMLKNAPAQQLISTPPDVRWSTPTRPSLISQGPVRHDWLHMPSVPLNLKSWRKPRPLLTRIDR